MQVPRTTLTPRVDASSDDPAWKTAAVISSLELSRGADAKLKAAPTSVRLLWDAKFFYLRFECADEEPFAPFMGRDQTHYNGDVVEVFLDPVGDARQYIELQVTPKNQIFDQLFLLTCEARSDERRVLMPEIWARDVWTNLVWNMEGFQTATAILRDENKAIGWRADLAIPAAPLLQRLGKSEFGPMTMRLNVLRYDWLQSPQGSTTDKTSRQLVAMNWSPVQYGMPHMSPQAMGFITFKER